ncbi:hypothetical protein V7S76_08720 [Aquirufa sp. ROCK2-A2]
MENQTQSNKKTWQEPELTIITITNGKAAQPSESSSMVQGS